VTLRVLQYLSPGREIFFTPLYVGWHLGLRVLSIGIKLERRIKPVDLDLTGGASTLVLSYWFTCPCWLSPTHDDLDSTQILTRYCGVKSQIVSQLTNTGTTPTRQVPIVQPLWVIETTTDRVRARASHPSDNPDGTGSFISRQYKPK
jgi:hypothetical protein